MKNKIIALSYGDLKNISRDSMLLISVLGPLIFAVALRFGLPFATDKIKYYLNFDITSYYAFIMSFSVLIVPMMIGMLVGFIILDERDENIIAYYSVTPLTKTGYLMFRVLSPAIIGFIFSFIMLFISNIISLNYLALIPVIFMISLEAPIAALFLGVFAANKVEGLALSKALGIFMLVPIGGYFINSKWQLLLGIAPPYWASKAFLLSNSIGLNYWFYITIGIGVHLFYLNVLLKKFIQKEA